MVCSYADKNDKTNISAKPTAPPLFGFAIEYLGITAAHHAGQDLTPVHRVLWRALWQHKFVGEALVDEVLFDAIDLSL
jgi:hypothetical protein